jgi:hypothetical protein
MSSLRHCCVVLLFLINCVTPAAGQSSDWATYGYEAGCSSYNPDEPVLDPQSVGGLQLQWSADPGAAITSQPIVVHNAVIAGLPSELVWRRQLLTETIACGQQPGGLFGIAGTPVYEPATHRIYAADGTVMGFIAPAATASGDGILQIPGTTGGAAAFAVASINVGAGGTLTASTDFGGAELPVNATLCQTDPASGQCLAPPAVSRLFVRFTDAAGVPHGSTSVALRTD